MLELLVVIFIITILAGLLLPVLSQVKSQAKLSYCLNNERQLGIGLTMYTDDAKEVFPSYDGWASWGGPIGTGKPFFMNLFNYGYNTERRPVNPYIPIKTTFDCPGDKGSSLDFTNWTSVENCFTCTGTSYVLLWRQYLWTDETYGFNGNYGWGYYGMECFTGDSGDGYSLTPSMKRSDFQPFVSQKIVLLEFAGCPGRFETKTDNWHNQEFNQLFADNHVQKRKYQIWSNRAIPVDPRNGYW